jgi:hypothetical protein
MCLIAGGPKSYWLIVPAAAQPVEVLPGQLKMLSDLITCYVVVYFYSNHAMQAGRRVYFYSKCIFIQITPCRRAEELLIECAAAAQPVEVLPGQLKMLCRSCNMLCSFQITPAAGGRKIYWLIEPAARQPAARALSAGRQTTLLLCCQCH